jgi:hypothetical protein
MDRLVNLMLAGLGLVTRTFLPCGPGEPVAAHCRLPQEQGALYGSLVRPCSSSSIGEPRSSALPAVFLWGVADRGSQRRPSPRGDGYPAADPRRAGAGTRPAFPFAHASEPASPLARNGCFLHCGKQPTATDVSSSATWRKAVGTALEHGMGIIRLVVPEFRRVRGLRGENKRELARAGARPCPMM